MVWKELLTESNTLSVYRHMYVYIYIYTCFGETSKHTRTISQTLKRKYSALLMLFRYVYVISPPALRMQNGNQCQISIQWPTQVENFDWKWSIKTFLDLRHENNCREDLVPGQHENRALICHSRYRGACGIYVVSSFSHAIFHLKIFFLRFFYSVGQIIIVTFAWFPFVSVYLSISLSVSVLSGVFILVEP